MKEFVKSIIKYLIAVTILVLMVNLVYRNIMVPTDNTGKFLRMPKQIQICNFGSSHGMHSYYYSVLEDRYGCFNFALDAQSMAYDERILETYRYRLSPGAVVIIDISYFTPYGVSETESDSFLSKNKRYYRILPKDKIMEYDVYTDVLTDKLALLDASFADICSTLKYVGRYGNVKSYPDTNDALDKSSLDKNADSAAKRHTWNNRRDDNGVLIYNEDNIKALYEMIDICRECGATPVMVIVPYLSEYTDRIAELDPGFYDDFYGWIDGVAEEKGADYFDYSRDERFCHNYDLFYDADHMNMYGAKKFTGILWDEVLKDKLMQADS